MELKYNLTKIVFITSVVLLVSVSACDVNDLLTPTAYGKKTSENFWQTSGDAISAINACYAPLLSLSHHENTLGMVPSDNAYRAGDHAPEAAIENFTVTPNNTELGTGWADRYTIIRRATNVLTYVPKIDMDQSQKDRILGQAHFLRGYMYWRFAKYFGGVPIITEEDIENGTLNKPRATLQETYDQIESDMKAAANLLPLAYNSKSDVGRPVRGAAWGYLSKLYVYEKRFQEAIVAGEKVINGPYPLAPNYSDNFTYGKQDNPEVLFKINSSSGWAKQIKSKYTTPRPWGGWDFHEPYSEFVNSFESGDVRQSATVMMPGDTIDLGGKQGPTVFEKSLAPSTGYLYKKWASWRPEGGLNEDLSVPIMRSAEVYLLVAEAKIRSGGNGDDEINAIRRRAGLPLIHNATMSDVIKEFRHELGGSGNRHFNLMRWDKAGIIDIQKMYSRDLGPLNKPRYFQIPKNYYYPIPQEQIDLSKGVLKQNPGYAGYEGIGKGDPLVSIK